MRRLGDPAARAELVLRVCSVVPRCGADHHFGFLSGSQSYYSGNRWQDHVPVDRANSTAEYSTISYGAAAVAFVEAHPDPETVPFFLYLPWQAVHSPYNPVPCWDSNTSAYAP